MTAAKPVTAAKPTTAQRLEELGRRRAEAVNAGSQKAVDKQHDLGKLTARERLELFLDHGSFVETGAMVRHRSHEFGMERNRPYGDGVITGYGTVDGRPVCVFAHDFTVLGGSLGEVHGEKIVAIMDRAEVMGCPIIGLNDSGGARIQEGVVSLAYYAEIGVRNVRLSGVVPQISLILGPCAGGAAYSPATTDFTIMAEGTSHMFVTGPEVVAATMGERNTAEELGGPAVHATKSGVAHYVAESEKDALEYVRVLLSYLPLNWQVPPPAYAHSAAEKVTAADLALDRLIPDRDVEMYDMRRVLDAVLDDGELLEVQDQFGASLLCGFGRIEGQTVGVVANQPMVRGGVIDIDASVKGARFVRFCDAFGIPIVTFVDVPGYLPGRDQEHQGIVRHGAKMTYSYIEATVPQLTVITRKAYGGGYAVMGSKHFGADVNLAWPTAEIAVMGAEGAAQVLGARQIAAAAEQGRAEEERARLIGEYREKFANPYYAAERGYIDAVIMPHETRLELARALRALRGTRKPRPAKIHGNIPL